jgi:hypothetical protein
MRKARVTNPRLNDQEEEQMRPSRFLGYNRDTLGMHALQKEMFRGSGVPIPQGSLSEPLCTQVQAAFGVGPLQARQAFRGKTAHYAGA